VLGKARTARVGAIDAKAEDRAPVTLAGADRLLAQAEEVLQGDRQQRAEARSLAERSTEEYLHAARVAKLAVEVDSDRKRGPEQLIMHYESGMAQVGAALGFTPRLSDGPEAIAGQTIAAIQGQTDDRQALTAQLDTARHEADVMEARLVHLADRETELKLRERHEQRLGAVRDMFNADEADVVLRGDQLMVRLYSLSFPSGSSEIRPENFSLLSKVQRTLREYPAAAVRIEGHTDSVGDVDYNHALSQRRANAVREYLLANMVVAAEQITSIGSGENSPIANNETEEGRAKNRRIDVVLDLAE
jgi:outer membrane protein OmpA-like peptidoglycan-associated protein